jgi:putative hydrolase of the HAD superfamily
VSGVVLWDFYGTLARRMGGWSGALAEALAEHDAALAVAREQIVLHLQRGYPWHTPDVPHPELRDADAWWARLEAVFRAAYLGLGLDARMAGAVAVRVRTHYLRAERWELYHDTLPALEALCQRGWRQAVLSNHVPELPDLVTALGLSGYFRARRLLCCGRIREAASAAVPPGTCRPGTARRGLDGRRQLRG